MGPKILFIHNTAMWYRRPFFLKLSQIYPVKFIFTHIKASKEIYDVEISTKIEGLDGVNYKALKNYFRLAPGVIKEAMGSYDILVGGNWDTIPELLETLTFLSIARIRKKKYIIWTEEWDWKEESRAKKLVKPLIKLILRNSSAVLVPGSKHREYAISLGSTPEKVFIIPNASNITYKQKIDIPELKERYKLENKKIILYVGRLIERKGVQYLIRAFDILQKEMDDVVLIIVGTGEYKKELEELSRELKIQDKFHFQGNIKNEELPRYYQICDLCVVPSITHGIGDPWVFVLNEAMYFAKPVIATDAVGAAFDMVENGENGFIVPQKDSKSLYKSMKEVLSHPELTQAMGKKSKSIVEERFRYKNMVNGFNEAINYLSDHK